MANLMRSLWRPAVALGVALALAGGCSNDDNPEPSQPVFTGGSAGVSAGSSGAGGSTAGTGGVSGTSGEGGAAGSTAGTGGTDAGAAGTTGGTAGTTGGSAGDGGAAGTTGGAAGTGGASGTAGAGGQQNCDGPNGCYACKPTTLPQYLNHCSDSTCVPFDNAARLPLYKNNTLPPLP